MKKYKRIPQHVGVIPDGNRRWAVGQGLGKQDGYKYGIGPGLKLYEALSWYQETDVTLGG